MNSRGTSTNVRTITFDLILINETRDEIKIYEFTEYKMARQVCNKLEEILDIVIKDEYLEIRRKAPKYKSKR